MRRALWVACCLATLPAWAEPLEQTLRRAAEQAPPRSDSLSSDAELQRYADEAASRFRQGDFQGAVDRFDRAAAAAFRSGAAGRAFEFTLAAAELQRTRGELLDAADRFERAALANANDPRAASAHYAACESLGQLAASDKTPEALERLDQMLEQHVAGWPRAESVAMARWQRVKLLAVRHDWATLLVAVRLVAPGEAHHVQAQALLVDAHEGLLHQAASAEEQLARLGAMTTDLQPMILGNERRWPLRWNALQLRAAEVLGRGHLVRGTTGADYTVRLLGMALRTASEPRSELIATHVVGLLAQGRLDLADEVLASQVADASIRRGLLLTAQERLATTAPEEWPQEVDRLRTTIAALASSVGTTRADVLARAGQLEQAVRGLDQQIRERPHDARLQVARAELLAQSARVEDQQRALRHWHEIEHRSPRASHEWFTARLERLRLLGRLGRHEEMQKLLKLTELLAPELGGAALRPQFETLRE